MSLQKELYTKMNHSTNEKPPTNWGLGDLIILVDILLLALGFFFQNYYMVLAGCVLGFTMLSLVIFVRPGQQRRKRMMDKEKDNWDDMK